MSQGYGREFSIRFVFCLVLLMVSVGRTQADPTSPTGPAPAAKFSFHSKVSLDNLDPDVVEARIGCIISIDGKEVATGLSSPLDLNAQNQPATVFINDVSGEPTAYDLWVCVLLFDLASEGATMEGAWWFDSELMQTQNLQDCPASTKELYGLKLCTLGATTYTAGSILVKP